MVKLNRRTKREMDRVRAGLFDFECENKCVWVRVKMCVSACEWVWEWKSVCSKEDKRTIKTN